MFWESQADIPTVSGLNQLSPKQHENVEKLCQSQKCRQKRACGAHTPSWKTAVLDSLDSPTPSRNDRNPSSTGGLDAKNAINLLSKISFTLIIQPFQWAKFEISNTSPLPHVTTGHTIFARTLHRLLWPQYNHVEKFAKNNIRRHRYDGFQSGHGSSHSNERL